MNESLTQMMNEAEAELRRALPSFDASNLIGTNMDVFHKNPAHQRSMLDQLTGTHEGAHHDRQSEVLPRRHGGP
jgi:methyl-accepting chemotaxis protein